MTRNARYQRQWMVHEIGPEGQKKLKASRVAIVGVGALGSVSASLLARAGVGTLHLIDRDFIEMDNLQRQVLFDENDVRRNLPKAIAAQQKLQQVNSEITVEAHVSDLNPDTIHELLKEVDLIVDGTDNFETRFLINDFSLKTKIPWIYGGALKLEGASYVVLPGEGPCLRCLFPDPPNPGEFQTCDQVGILASVSHVVASFQMTEAIKILIGASGDIDRRFWKFDLWQRRFHPVNVENLKSNLCEGCRNQKYPYHTRPRGITPVTLCGRNAVQIFQEGHKPIDFVSLAAKLTGQVDFELNEYVLNILPGPFKISVFANGRAIVKGTEDAGQAKSLYARYVGN